MCGSAFFVFAVAATSTVAAVAVAAQVRMFSVGFLLLTARSVHISGGTQYGISIVGGVVAVQQPPYQVWIAGVVFFGSGTAMVHPFGDCCWWFWWTVVYIGKQVTHFLGRAL